MFAVLLRFSDNKGTDEEAIQLMGTAPVGAGA